LLVHIRAEHNNKTKERKESVRKVGFERKKPGNFMNFQRYSNEAVTEIIIL